MKTVAERLAHPWVLPLLVIAVTFSVYGWSLDLPFQLDDYTQIPLTPSRFDHISSRIAGDDVPLQGDHLFRPVLWGTFYLDHALSGLPARADRYRISSLVLHALASLLLASILRRSAGRFPALCGALFFCAHPAGYQAVTWIAARGDLLMVVFGLLATLAVMQRRFGFEHALTVGTAGMLSMLAKESATPLVAVLVLVSMIRMVRGKDARWTHLLALLTPLALGVGLRWMVTGSPMPSYALGARPQITDLRHLGLVLDRCGQRLVTSWNLFAEGADHPPALAAWGLAETGARRLLAAITVVLVAVGALVGGSRSRRGLSGAAAWMLIAALPLCFVVPRQDDAAIIRAYYAVTVGWAAALGLGLCGWVRRGRAGIGIAGLLFLLQAGPAADAWVQTKTLEREAGLRQREQLAAVRRLARELGPTGTLASVGFPPGHAGLPMVGGVLSSALGPPFEIGGELAAIVYVPHEDALATPLRRVPPTGPFRMLRWSEGPPLAGPIHPGPPSRGFEAAKEAGAWRLNPPLVPRSVAGLRWIPEQPWPEGRLLGALEVRDTEGAIRSHPVEVLAPSGRRPLPLGWPLHEDWLLSAPWTHARLSIEGVETRPEPLEALPEIVLQGPTDSHRLDRALEFRCALPAPTRRVRGHFDFVLGAMRYRLTTVWSRERPFEKGPCTLRAAEAVTEASTWPGLSWSVLPQVAATQLRPLGVHALQVEWWLEASAGRSGLCTARSAARLLTLDLP